MMSDSTAKLAAEERRKLLARLLEEKARRQATTAPLSYGQRALWFLYQLDPRSPAYNLMHASYVRADLDREAFSRAFQTLVGRHAVLRTTYGARDGKPLQFIHPARKFSLERIEVFDWSRERLEAELHRQADVPFDLVRGPVFRVQLFDRGAEKNILLITAHHIALDFWSLDLLLNELEDLYRSEVSGNPVSLPALEVSYADYVRWQEGVIEGQEGERLYDYWRQQLGGEIPVLDLPTDRPRPPVQTFNGRSYRFHLPDDLARQVVALAQKQGATLYATLLAVFQLLLYRYSGQQDILVGSFSAGRSRAELESIVGYFLNPIVLRARLSPEMRFSELLGQVRQTVVDGITHGDFPFSLLVERHQPMRDPSRSPVFQVAFGLDRLRRLSADATGAGHGSLTAGDPATLGLKPFLFGQQGAPMDLMLTFLSVGDSLSGALQYNSDLFDESTIVRLVDHFRQLLKGAVANPEERLDELRLLSEQEERVLLVDWNDTAAEFPENLCLHELFEAQVGRTPEAVAVVHGERRLTYRELDGRANRLAHHLKALGLGPDLPAGVCVERSPEMLVAILGVLKAGGAYVPLAPDTPAERAAFMLNESRARILLTQMPLLAQFRGFSGKVVCLDRGWPDIARDGPHDVEATASPENLAYVIFTSGSTGKPKGVQIEHRAVVNFLTSMQQTPGITAEDTLPAITTLTFDISALELFLPLTVGAKVVVVDREVAADGRQLAETLRESGATIMQATPASWRLLIDAGWRDGRSLKALCGGEALPADLADQLLERCASVWNMYGPTETTIWSAVDRVQPGRGQVSIGRPIANTQIYVLDSRCRPVPIGVPGDLYIGGAGLARGYLNRPELTAERFVSIAVNGGREQRLYKTGDLACFRPDGRLHFLGRQDFQVKVRGFRIELEEIEANLNEHPGIRAAVVTARQTGTRTDDKQLVAYVSPNGEPVPNTSELRGFLRQRLPDYMVPAVFVSVDVFPLNPAGKVDRRALPEPETSRPRLSTTYVAPRNDLETVLADIWASVLGIDEVGIHDNYFDLGGASIQSLEVAARAEKAGCEITPTLIFQHPTVAELATAVEARQAACREASSAPVADRETIRDESAEVSARKESRPAPSPAGDRLTSRRNTIVESLGVYLPPKEVTTKEVLNGCKKKMWFPIEKMTGIKARRMAGETEFASDLAIKAAEACLANSQYDVDDIDLVICANISHIESKTSIGLEPNTSMKVKRHFGFKNAEVFDVTNACGGMFTAISIVDAFINCGVIRRGMVVSGEYITAITQTAQLEITGFLDPRLACLTVGDAGAAVILEAAPHNEVGFHELEMYTLSKYSRMCIGRLTEQPHGGPIMIVPDPMEHTAVSVHHSVSHSRYLLERCGWSPEKLQLLIMHQTSDRSLRDAVRAINKAYRRKICNDGNTVNNLATRGNTASTTHFVAVWDNIVNGRINSGDSVLFGITGSGQTIGTGVYTFDDLPDRVREARETGRRPARVPSPVADPPPPALGRVRVHSIGTLPLNHSLPHDTLQLAASAAEACLKNSAYSRSDVQLLLFAGMLRTGYIQEPAIAALIGGDLKMNDIIESPSDKKTFTFDVFNGSLGFLNACQVANHLIQAGTYQTAMIIASEAEVNAEWFPEDELGVHETASAVILERSPYAGQGFGRFLFRYDTEHFDVRRVFGHYRDGKPFCNLQQDPALEDYYLNVIPPVVNELLDAEGLALDQLQAVLPPQLSPSFPSRLTDALGIAPDRMARCVEADRDLFTSATPYALQQVFESGQVRRGDIGLIINVSSGIQVGCATYCF